MTNKITGPADLRPVDATNIKLRPCHPGGILAEEVEFRGLNANSLAIKLHVPANRLRAIMQGKRAISPDTAIRLEKFLGIKASLWVRMQSDHDLAIAERDFRDDIAVDDTSLHDQMAAE
jgi:addiction module HigA family antidote